MPRSRWCTAGPSELPVPPLCLDEVSLKAAGVAGGSIVCHGHSARISDCIILPWWFSSEWTAEGTVHQSLWQQHCPLRARNGWKARAGRGMNTLGGPLRLVEIIYFSLIPSSPLAWLVCRKVGRLLVMREVGSAHADWTSRHDKWNLIT